jgi:hypothetical protein
VSVIFDGKWRGIFGVILHPPVRLISKAAPVGEAVEALCRLCGDVFVEMYSAVFEQYLALRLRNRFDTVGICRSDRHAYVTWVHIRKQSMQQTTCESSQLVGGAIQWCSSRTIWM